MNKHDDDYILQGDPSFLFELTIGLIFIILFASVLFYSCNKKQNVDSANPKTNIYTEV